MKAEQKSFFFAYDKTVFLMYRSFKKLKKFKGKTNIFKRLFPVALEGGTHS